MYDFVVCIFVNDGLAPGAPVEGRLPSPTEFLLRDGPVRIQPLDERAIRTSM